MTLLDNERFRECSWRTAWAFWQKNASWSLCVFHPLSQTQSFILKSQQNSHDSLLLLLPVLICRSLINSGVSCVHAYIYHGAFRLVIYMLGNLMQNLWILIFGFCYIKNIFLFLELLILNLCFPNCLDFFSIGTLKYRPKNIGRICPNIFFLIFSV